MAQDEVKLPALETSRTDDPQVVREAQTEDYSLHVVPRSWRNSRFSLAMAFYAIFSAMFYLIVSATTALAVGAVNTIIGMVVVALIAGAINYFISRYATGTGLTVALFSRSIFGQVGAALATLIFAATAIYYAVFEGSVIAVVFNEYFGVLPLEVWYLIVVVTTVPLVLGGVGTWLDKVNGVLLPIYVLGLAAVIIVALFTYDYSNEWLTYQPETSASFGPGWVFAISIYMGAWIQMMLTMDYARFGRTEDKNFNSVVTFGPIFYLLTWLLNGLIGLFVIFILPTEGELTETSGVLGIVALLGFVGVVFVWASQTRINTANLYAASSNLQSFANRAFGLRLSRVTWLIIAGGIVYLMMLTDVFSYLLQALRVQGVFVVSWVGIALAQIIHEQRRPERRAEFRPGRVPMVNPAGLVCWLVSTAIGILLVFLTGAFGATWALPLTFLISFALYAVSLRFAKRSWFIIERPHDPRTEVEDPWEDRVLCKSCERRYIAYEMDRDPSSGHEAICASCASQKPDLYRSAKREARAYESEQSSESLRTYS